MYQYSVFELFGGITAITTAVIQVIRRPRSWRTYGLGAMLILLGVSVLALSCISNSLAAHNWDTSFMVAFLQLKVVGSCLTRGPAYAGYILIVWGISVLIITGFGTARN